MPAGSLFPPWDQKVKAIQEWVSWATRAKGDWFYTNEARGTPQPNEPYFRLIMRRLLETGVPETLNVDLENLPEDPGMPLPDVTAENPRAEVTIAYRTMQIDLRIYSYDQDANQAAWAVADFARTRMRMPTPRERFLADYNVGLIDLFQVIHMPHRARAFEGNRDKPTETDDRFYSEALIEMRMSTVVAESDASAVGTFIERTRVSGTLEHCTGDLLDPSLQIDDELMGLPLTP